MAASKLTPKRGIIQDMTEVKEMYKIGRYIDSNRYHKGLKKFKTPLEAINDCAKNYSSKWPWRNERKVHGWLNNSIEHKFTKVVGDPENGHYLRVEHGKGKTLLSKKWSIYRDGLREITMKERPQTVAMYKLKYKAWIGLMGVVIGAAATIIAQIIVAKYN